MEEENKNTSSSFHFVSENTTYDDNIIDKFKGTDSLHSSETRESKVTTGNDVKTTRTVTEEYVSVDLGNGITAKHVNDKFVIKLPNGNEMDISNEEFNKMFENGIEDGTYVRVRGIRKVTVYEKIEVLQKKKKYTLALLLIPLLLGILLTFGKCGSKKKSSDLNNPDKIVYIDDNDIDIADIDNDDIDIDDIDKIIKTIYQQRIIEVLDTIEPGMISRVMSDAIDAADYDMELLLKNGYASEDIIDNYGVIYNNIVKPSADYIERLNTFREAVKNPDSFTSEQMLVTAQSLLTEYQPMVQNAKSAVSLHLDTTKRCIDVGLRDDNYQYPYKHELSVLNEQKQNLTVKEAKVVTLLSSLTELDKYKEDIISGKIKYTEIKDGFLLFLENGEVQMIKTTNFTYDNEVSAKDFNSDQLVSDENAKTF